MVIVVALSIDDIWANIFYENEYGTLRSYHSVYDWIFISYCKYRRIDFRTNNNGYFACTYADQYCRILPDLCPARYIQPKNALNDHFLPGQFLQ